LFEAYQLDFLTVPEIITIAQADSSADQSIDLTMALVDNLEMAWLNLASLRMKTRKKKKNGC
jgi:hypothetical protein